MDDALVFGTINLFLGPAAFLAWPSLRIFFMLALLYVGLALADTAGASPKTRRLARLRTGVVIGLAVGPAFYSRRPRSQVFAKLVLSVSVG